jgi:hypothetical protein
MDNLDISDSIVEEGRNIKYQNWDAEPDDIRVFLMNLYDGSSDIELITTTTTSTDTKISQYLGEIKSHGFSRLKELYTASNLILNQFDIPLADKSKLINKIEGKRITSYMKLRYAIFMFICILAVAVDIVLLAFNTLIVTKLGGVGGDDNDRRRHNGIDHNTPTSSNTTGIESPTELTELISYIYLFHMIEFTVPFLYDVIIQFIFNRPFKYKFTTLIRQFSLVFAALTSGIAALLVYISLEAYESEAHYLEYASFLFILILDLVVLYRNNRDFHIYYKLYGRRNFVIRYWRSIATLIVTLLSMVGVIVVIALRYHNYEWLTHYVEFSTNIIVVISTYMSNDIRQIK